MGIIYKEKEKLYMVPNQQQINIILDVVNKIAPKYVFGYYDVDDIKQESYIICCEALDKYDESRPLENFLSKHLSNRLKTLIRDKYSRKNLESDRHILLNQIKKGLIDLKSSLTDDIAEDCFEEDIFIRDLFEKIMDNINPSMRNDLNRLLNDVKINSSRRQALFNRIKDIINEDW